MKIILFSGGYERFDGFEIKNYYLKFKNKYNIIPLVYDEYNVVFGVLVFLLVFFYYYLSDWFFN